MWPTDNRRILVVDDNEAIHVDFRKIIGETNGQTEVLDAAAADLFGDEGTPAMPEKRFEVHSAYQGQEAFDMVQRSLDNSCPFAVAFVDVRMPPGWDGIETIERIWAVDADLQVVVCTAYSDYSWNDMIARLGETDRLLILKKPFDNVEVWQLATALCSKWILLQQSRRTMEELHGMVNERTAKYDEAIDALQREVAVRQASEAALRNAEMRTRAILEAAAEGIMTVDDAGVIESINPAAERMFGYDHDKLVGATLPSLLSAPYGDEYVRGIQSWSAADDRKTIGEKLVGGRRQITALERTGVAFPIELAMSETSVFGHRMYTCVVHDMTEQRQLEGQLLRSQKLEAVGFLAGGIAHEFNNLLQAIGGYTRCAMDGLAHDDQRRQDLEQVLKASNRAAMLTSQLLGFSRRQVLQQVALDPHQLVSDFVKMLRPLIGENIDIEAVLATDVGALFADPGLLEQMLLNLCLNARDAMPTGGQLTLTLQRTELSDKYCDLHSSAKPGPYVMFSVADTGCGMSSEVKTHIFEPFFTTKEVGRGTGLGLAMVYGLVQQHHGLINVYSEVGLGTTFRVYLPTTIAA